MSLTEKTDIRDSDEKVVEIEMEQLRTFTNHLTDLYRGSEKAPDDEEYRQVEMP